MRTPFDIDVTLFPNIIITRAISATTLFVNVIRSWTPRRPQTMGFLPEAKEGKSERGETRERCEGEKRKKRTGWERRARGESGVKEEGARVKERRGEEQGRGGRSRGETTERDG